MSDQYYVGIDLGPVNTCLAYADSAGNSYVSKNEGGGLLPSTILFTDEGKVVGSEACERSQDYDVSDSVFCFKRLMGEDFKRYVGDVSYDPSEMSALVLTKVIKNYTKNTGQSVKSAVITVPGDFSDAERYATMNAARIAGIERVELLNESIAAGIAYRRTGNDYRDRNVIIYDLGGGTLDVTVMKISGSTFTVLSDESSKDLGGRDWDLQLAAIIQRKVLDSCGLTLDDVISNGDFRRSVMIEAEKQKIVLENNPRAVSTVKLNGEQIRFTVTREEFEESTYRLMMKTIEMLGFALRNAKMQMSGIDTIVLVGGSTLMPHVKRSLEEAFPSVNIVSFDPAHAVARGAALYARSVFGTEDITVTPVSTRTIGVVAGIDGVEKICNVIFRNTPLPAEKTLMCRPKRDDQEILEISLYESMAKEGKDFIDISEGKKLLKHEFPLSGKVSRGRTKIPVKFRIDTDGCTSVTVECNGATEECVMHRLIPDGSEEMCQSAAKMEDVL